MDDVKFLKKIMEATRVGSTLFRISDVIRLYQLAGIPKHKEQFDSNYYRITDDEMLMIVENIVLNRKLKRANMNTAKTKKHLRLIK